MGVSKWLGSLPFISHEVRPFWKGSHNPTPGLRGLTVLTVVTVLITCKSWDDPPYVGADLVGVPSNEKRAPWLVRLYRGLYSLHTTSGVCTAGESGIKAEHEKKG